MKALHLFLFFLTSSFCYSQIRLPKLISDGMILQRDAKVKLWGWAASGEKVSLNFDSKNYSSIANKDGKWIITLSKQKAGGPYQLVFSASNIITVSNVLFGDVWICSGQSNMELAMERVRDKYPEVITNANNPNIRQFLVPDKYNFEKPQGDVEEGEWLSVSKETIFKFSAVAYFFADELYKKYQVPIGLINVALGGSPAEAWISEDALKEFPSYYNELQKFKDQKLIEQIESADKKVAADWYSQLNKSDKGWQNGWLKKDVDDSSWQRLDVPGYWADQGFGNLNGAFWYRREITLHKSFIEKPSSLWLGRIVDADSVFINGNFVGATSYQYPPRKYAIRPGILNEGKNTIAAKVISNSGKGGFVPGKPYWLASGKDTIDLKGKWKFQIGATMQALPGSTFIRWKPTGLFNAMIAPLTNYSIKGAIWYQGESNTKKTSDYFSLMKSLIGDWRKQWRQKDFPFLFVQLANFMDPKDFQDKSSWAELRQAQLETLKVRNTGMAVAIDLGEWNDIHPLNKLDVGKRLALQAMKVAYREKKLAVSGPLCKSVQNKNGKLILSFSNVGGGLISSDNKELKCFYVAGVDKKFGAAKAEIIDDKIILSTDSISNPFFVRYAWADNPQRANLYNKEGLPASPFETSVR